MKIKWMNIWKKKDKSISYLVILDFISKNYEPFYFFIFNVFFFKFMKIMILFL